MKKAGMAFAKLEDRSNESIDGRAGVTANEPPLHHRAEERVFAARHCPEYAVALRVFVRPRTWVVRLSPLVLVKRGVAWHPKPPR